MNGVKPSNPKDAIGSDKLPLHLVPPSAVAMASIGLLEGMAKYGRANWREAGIRASIYIDACKRHLDAWFEGEDYSPEGVPHLANALACLCIIVDAETQGTMVDDRQYKADGQYRALVDKLTPLVKMLKERHSNLNPKHYSAGTLPGVSNAD